LTETPIDVQERSSFINQVFLVAGLTFSVALFFLLVLIPGHMTLLFAGRPKADRTLGNATIMGGAIFGLCFVFWLTMKVARGSTVLDGFLALMGAAGSARPEPVPLLPFIWVFGMIYFLAMALGLLELALVTKLACPQKGGVWLRRMILRWTKRRPEFQVRPGFLLFDAMLGYRVAGRRPLVKVWLPDGVLTGECLRYAWDGGESLLLRDMDDPAAVRWVSLKEAQRVEFLNSASPPGGAASGERLLSEQDRLLLDLMVWPGYADEVEEELRRKRQEQAG